MRLRHVICLLCVLLCWPQGAFAGEDRLELVDARGRKVSLRTPIQSVVVLTTDGLEVLRLLGAMDLVIGAGSLVWKDAEFWPELQHVGNVGKWNDPDPEAIVRLMPDLVLCYGHTPGSSLEEKVGGLGIQIFRIDCFRPSTIKEEIRTLGLLLGRQEKAEEFAAWMKGHESKALNCIRSSGETVTAYMEAYSDYKASGVGTAMHELCGMAGGRNIADITGIQNPEVTTEWVMSMSPEVVVKAGSIKKAYSEDSHREMRNLHQRIINRNGFSQLPAYKNGRFHILAGDVGPGPRCVVGLTLLAKWFHPETCRHLDAEAIHTEYMERFQGMPLKGCYAFPE